MIATSFDASNMVLGRPKGWSEEDCDPLSVWIGNLREYPVVVSCWKVTQEELDEINRTKRVWLMVCGITMPPVILSGVNILRQAQDDLTTGD